MLASTYTTLKAVKLHTGKSSVCQAGSIAVKEADLETRRDDDTEGCTGSIGPAQDLLLKVATNLLVYFF